MGLIKVVGRKISRLAARKPNILFWIQEGYLRFGDIALDLKAASWVVRRPEWLKTKSKSVPTPLEPEMPTADHLDETIATRLIERFKLASGGERNLIPDSSMWGTLRQVHFSAVRRMVEAGDSKLLSAHLAKIFRTEAVNGFSYGTTFDRLPHRWAYLPVAIELSIVTFAECLGVLRAETHEQGQVAYWRSQFSEEQLIEQIEDMVGFRIDAPRFGDPRGIMFGGRFVVRETFSHLYTAYRIREVLNRVELLEPLKIVEVGGGYGGTCYWLRKLLGDRICRYAIVDLPEVSLVQSYFLGSVDPLSLVVYGEPLEGVESPIQLVPHFRLSDVDFRPNVFINQDSMPEMPMSEVERYLDWGENNVDGVFISFNQEAYSPWAGIPQVHVPAVVAKFSRYQRLSRETSWDRRGYVEEVYMLS